MTAINVPAMIAGYLLLLSGILLGRNEQLLISVVDILLGAYLVYTAIEHYPPSGV